MSTHQTTSTYRRHHAEITAIADSLLTLLGRADAPSRLLDACALLAALDAAVDTQLVLEDHVLYPRLLSHSDATLRSAAARCRAASGGMHRVFRGYRDAWTDLPTMTARFPAFRTETRAVLSRLDGRLRREEQDLFPVLDRLGW